MSTVDFLSPLHKSTQRDYLGRVNAFPKAEAARIAGQFGREYWDGERHLGYGGYRDDGRWKVVAQAFIEHYGLKPGQRVLDVGCGKAFLLNELRLALPGLEVQGIDISAYALEDAPEGVRPHLQLASAEELPFADQTFDFVYSLNTLHNLPCHKMVQALKEIERVGKGPAYLVVESFRNEEEKVNLLYWQLTCRCFFSPEEWQWFFDLAGYRGDHSFIYFE